MANMRTLDLNLLRVFDAMMKLRNVTKTGETLGLTQPAVSAALARLRDHVGDQLFVRVGNKMVPTPRAEALGPPLADALARLTTAFGEVAVFDPALADGVMTLRGADFFSTRLMPSLAADFARQAPTICLRFLDSAHGNLFDLLEEGGVDLALEQPLSVPDWVSQTLLFPSPFVLVAAADNPLILDAGIAAGQVLPLDLFCSLPHALRSSDGSMTGMTDTSLAALGKSRRVALALPHFDAVMRSVACSGMIAVVPAQLAKDSATELGLRVYQPPISIPVPKMQLYWHRRNDRAPAHIWLRQRVLEAVARLWGADQDFDGTTLS